MEREEIVYLTAMQDSLKNKYELLKKILEVTEKQEQILKEDEIDMESFDELLEIKEMLIGQVLDLDQGFQGIYNRIGKELEKHKQEYKPRILEMQNLIRMTTDLGVKIQALEQRNKRRFDDLAAKKRQEIQEFRLNNRTTNIYTQHMTNQHQQGQSYFLDKKK